MLASITKLFHNITQQPCSTKPTLVLISSDSQKIIHDIPAAQSNVLFENKSISARSSNDTSQLKDDSHKKMNKSNLNDIDDDSVSSFDSALVADQKMPSNDTTDKSNAQEYIADGGEISVGHMFESIECAKQTITVFAGCPVRQSSTRNMKYVEYSCFRSGSYTKKTSDCVSDENKRKSKSVKCGCKFCVRLKLTKCGTYEVYTIVNTICSAKDVGAS